MVSKDNCQKSDGRGGANWITIGSIDAAHQLSQRPWLATLVASSKLPWRL
jgi:hypothetical protein